MTAGAAAAAWAAAGLLREAAAQEVQIADFDSDGRLDLALACSYSDLDVFLNPGDGSFAAKTSFHTNTLADFRGFIFNPYRIAAGDVDGNGTVDLALVFTEAPRLASVLLNDGTGTFADSTLSHLNTGFVQGTIAVSDLDEDGRADVVLGADDRQIEVFLSSAGGGFVSKPAPQFLDYGAPFKIVDMNGDGHRDVVTDFGVFYGRGDGTLVPSYQPPARGSITAVGDVNGDGRPDLVLNAAGVLLNTTP